MPNSTRSEALIDNLSFLWLELTNQCNLQCVHCYAESSPWGKPKDIMGTDDYVAILRQAHSLGCEQVQFIGGEPTLHKDLPYFVMVAKNVGYSFIEVFSNLTRVDDVLLRCFKEYDVSIATSVYSHIPQRHDAITNKKGSFARTMSNIERLLEANIAVRCGIIVMEGNRDELEETVRFLKSFGVENTGVDRVRAVGRGKLLSADPESDVRLTELCGSCWRGSVCIAPDGEVSPCIMAKAWSVGSVCKEPLTDLVSSSRLHAIRERIYREVWLPLVADEGADAQCFPGCRPNCEPSCNPRCSPNCRPCWPAGKCNPKNF